ncbi:transposase [Burkholderia cenocepacia]|uniref:transposase n=1 Tax=Burkholderia cenocepacia TaxID=95486 RepID=UPI00188087C8
MGLFPKLYSAGSKSSLGSISKHRNAYVRMMVGLSARTLMIHMKRDLTCNAGARQRPMRRLASPGPLR